MVDMFIGASGPQLKNFLEKMQKLGGGTSAKPVLDEAAAALAAGDIPTARELYKEVLHQRTLGAPRARGRSHPHLQLPLSLRVWPWPVWPAAP